MRIGVIVDDMALAAWQKRALDMLPPDTEFLVYNCTNSRPGKRGLRRFFQYALNLAAIRKGMTRSVALGDLAGRIVARIDFGADHEGVRQLLPADLLPRIAADRLAAIVAFGMNPLHIPPDPGVPILVYRHGDAGARRGRPVGFDELLHGRRTMGQVVRILSGSCGSGPVVASAETKVHPHSHRATLAEAYRASQLILGRAVAAAACGTATIEEAGEKASDLPREGTVLRLFLRIARAKLGRLAYGALLEKRWQVATAEASPAALRGGAAFPARNQWRTLPCPRGYTFLADPFFDPGGAGILAEALNAASGKGEILRLEEGRTPVRLSDAGCHYSYPATVEEHGLAFVVPETAFWSSPLAFEASCEAWTAAHRLDLPGEPRLLDPTFLRHASGLYLFANIFEEGSGVLRLWRADSLFGRFTEHPRSPVRISPVGSRMAGALLATSEGLLRLGQDDSGTYGEGIAVFRITQLSPHAYCEEEAGTLRFESVRGPHTLNFRGGTALFDWYRDRFSLLAGVRRLRGRLHRRSASISDAPATAETGNP